MPFRNARGYVPLWWRLVSMTLGCRLAMAIALSPVSTRLIGGRFSVSGTLSALGSVDVGAEVGCEPGVWAEAAGARSAPRHRATSSARTIT